MHFEFLAVRWTTSAFFGAMVLVCPSAFAASPKVGDAYVYRLVNDYNGETVGQIRHEVTAASMAQGLVIIVTADRPSLGPARNEFHAPDGHWLRHALDNHGIPVEYEFPSALPVLPVRPTPGNAWSVRVSARVSGDYANRSVRIDGNALGNERIRVPAGEFDTLKVRRIIYAGDAGDFKTETRIDETVWYAPALGLTVRSETRSTWRQTTGCRPAFLCDYRGDWNVLELIEARAAGF